MRSGSAQFWPLLLCTTFMTVACGSGPRGQLQTVTLSPATANAQQFPDGQVSFTASGIFSNSQTPVPLTSKDVFWCVGSSSGQCDGFILPGAQVAQTGVAQCSPSFAGTVTVLAGTMSGTAPMPDMGQQLKIFGSAKLTCP